MLTPEEASLRLERLRMFVQRRQENGIFDEAVVSAIYDGITGVQAVLNCSDQLYGRFPEHAATVTEYIIKNDVDRAVLGLEHIAREQESYTSVPVPTNNHVSHRYAA